MAAIKLSREWFTPKPDDGNLSLSTRELRIRAAVQMLNSGDWIELEDGTRYTSAEELAEELSKTNMWNGSSFIVCPNCGANASNHYNCEYCGSLLVRFVDKNIDVTHTPYSNNSIVLPGLIKELQNNLEAQRGVLNKSDEESVVETVIVVNGVMECAVQNSNVIRFDLGDDDECGERVFPDIVDPGLAVLIEFSMLTDGSMDESFNALQNEQYQRFKRLASFPLFKKHSFIGHNNYGEEMRFFQFAIDFGEDVEGAARLLSDYLINVQGCLPNTPAECYTSVGQDAILATRERIADEQNSSEMTSSEVAPSSQLWEINTTSLVIIIVVVALLSVLFIIAL